MKQPRFGDVAHALETPPIPRVALCPELRCGMEQNTPKHQNTRPGNVRGTILQRLLAQAALVVPGKEDTVIQPVYLDATTSGRIITRGEIVVAGEETRRAFPRTKDFALHFRKTFTPESGPIKRGESPDIEFRKTVPIYRRFRQEVPEPLGHSQWTYRCTAVCGQTFNALSPFVDIKTESALELDLDHSIFREHAERVIRFCELLDKLHASGSTHGDLTLHNAMWDESGKAVLIDLAGSETLSEMSREQRIAAINDDFSELYRDLILAQYHVGRLEHPHAKRSIQQIEDLFPEEFLAKLNKLKTFDWKDDIS